MAGGEQTSASVLPLGRWPLQFRLRIIPQDRPRYPSNAEQEKMVAAPPTESSKVPWLLWIASPLAFLPDLLTSPSAR